MEHKQPLLWPRFVLFPCFAVSGIKADILPILLESCLNIDGLSKNCQNVMRSNLFSIVWHYKFYDTHSFRTNYCPQHIELFNAGLHFPLEYGWCHNFSVKNKQWSFPTRLSRTTLGDISRCTSEYLWIFESNNSFPVCYLLVIFCNIYNKGVSSHIAFHQKQLLYYQLITSLFKVHP